MKCPECGFNDSKVIDSRPTDNKIRRRRECLACKGRFTTYEIVENIPLMVLKKNQTIEAFDREKLINRIFRATIKRPIKLEQIEDMVESIVTELKNKFQKEVTSDKIGDMVLAKLKAVDRVAYIRFASVYRDFSDANGFIAVINELEETDDDELDL